MSENYKPRELMNKKEITTFYFIGMVFFVLAITGFIISFRMLLVDSGESLVNVLKLFLFILFSTLFLIICTLFIIWPIRLKIKFTSFYELPEALSAINTNITDVKVIQREHYKYKTELEGIRDEWKEGKKDFEKYIKPLEIELTKFGAVLQAFEKKQGELDKEMIEIRRKNMKLSTKIEDWEETTMKYFEFLERTLSFEDVGENYKKAINTSFEELSRLIKPLGLYIIRPEAGDEFDGRIHIFKKDEITTEVEEGKIFKCSSWGYISGSNIIKQADVIIAKKPEIKEFSEEKAIEKQSKKEEEKISEEAEILEDRTCKDNNADNGLGEKEENKFDEKNDKEN